MQQTLSGLQDALLSLLSFGFLNFMQVASHGEVVDRPSESEWDRLLVAPLLGIDTSRWLRIVVWISREDSRLIDCGVFFDCVELRQVVL